MSQNAEILRRLRKGDILTAMDALKDPKIQSFRLAARIKDLKDRGERIERFYVYNGHKRYAAYRKKR